MAIVLPDIKPKPCPECGMAGAHHWVERWSLRIDALISFFTRPFDRALRYAMPLVDRVLYVVFPVVRWGFLVTGLAVEVPDLHDHSSETAVALWNEANARGIRMTEIRILGLPRRLYFVRYRDKNLVFEGLPRPLRVQPSLSWIDDKAEVKRRFSAAGFPVPRGGVCRTERGAERWFAQLTTPVIVKPHEGTGGRHTTVHIQTREELRRAYWNAREVSPFAIVEEELVGPVYRVTLIGRKLVGILRREPPCVVGDGYLSIRGLVEKENKNPLRRGPVFAPIRIETPESIRELAWQHLTPESVLRKNECAFLHFKVNWGVGGTSWDETEKTHPENKKLFEAIGEFLGDDIVGIDFMIPDVSISWREARCGVIECNSLPLIGNHHFPYKGNVTNVAGKIWDMIFPESESK